jgi:ABC-type transport system involved in multi-copper enzyme maturation permease subunit
VRVPIPSIRAYELIKETFLRKTYIWTVHLIWFGTYGLFWLLLLPTNLEAGQFLLIWGGFLLPLALSAGIIGDDIASGRICVLATRPFWLGQLYLYRLLGLSLQGAVHILLAGGLVFVLDTLLGKGSPNNLAVWLFASWLMFNACAALSTSLSVVVGRSYNSLLVFFGVVFAFLLLNVLAGYWLEYGAADTLRNLFRYIGLPFGLLMGLAKGDYAKYSLSVGKYDMAKNIACVIHCLILTAAYAMAGILLLNKRQFFLQRD